MSRNIILFVTFVSLFVLASCTPSQNVITSNEQFWEGSDALSFDFVEENPPEIVFEDTPFSVGIEVENTGAHTLTGFMTLSIEDDYMCLVDDRNECSTFDAIDVLTLSVQGEIVDLNVAIDEYTEQLAATSDPDEQKRLGDLIQSARVNIERLRDSVAVENPYKTKWFSLEGRNIFNYNGGSMVLSYPAKAKSAGALSEEHDVQVIATACYDYATSWNQEICIDTDVYKQDVFQGGCEAEDVSLSSQGAPLAITRIETDMLPTGNGYVRPMFTIHVSNNGNGKVINKEKIAHACTATGLESRDYNMVFLKEFVLSSEELLYDFNGFDPVTGRELNPGADGDTISCSPNPLILKGRDDLVRCTVNEDVELDMLSINQAPYTATISMQFDYGYTLSQSERVTVQNIITY